VVTRTRPDGDVELLLVHRPRYDDWSLPKGKAEPGETDEACARREVEEETGLRCALGEPIATSDYRDARGRRKHVVYFAMTPPEGGEATPQNEVDDVRWLTLDRALETLSYERDREIVRRLAARPG
jgi:8-oxo-dGTP diphosphatase